VTATPEGLYPACGRSQPLRQEGSAWLVSAHPGLGAQVCPGFSDRPTLVFDFGGAA
jgi:hypothetical protein